MQKFTLIFLAIFTALSCHKEQDAPAAIVGDWKCLVCINKDQTWQFTESEAKQTFYAAGQEVWVNRFHYWQQNDTINLFNTGSETHTAMRVRFLGSAVCEVSQLGAFISETQYWERK